MYNPRITAKDRGVIKGVLRRAFSRSDLYKKVSDRARIEHHDPNRPRCQKWSFCEFCGTISPTWTMSVDHILPVIPTDKTMESMSLDELVNAIWCEESNLQNLCEPCHDEKTRAENLQRKAFRDLNKPPKIKKGKKG